MRIRPLIRSLAVSALAATIDASGMVVAQADNRQMQRWFFLGTRVENE